jgi:allophanate hydrolase subunit 2
VKGGFLSPLILGSRSMYKPVTPVNALKKEDLLTYRSLDRDSNKHNANVRFSPEIIESDVLEVYKGPEFNKLQPQIQKQLLELNLKVSKFNNRMAYQLAPTFNNNLDQIITAPVLPGTVQLTPSGQLIVLMRDCQTTGGYPRVLQLTEKAISIMSQKTTGNNLKFRLKE